MAQLDVTPFFRTLRRLRIGMTVFALICLPFGVLLMFLDDPSMSRAENIALKVGVGGFFLGFGTYFGYLGLRPPSKDKGIRTLTERSDEVVWICPVRNLNNGNHVATRYNLNLVDGTTNHVSVMPADEEQAERILRAHCPSALFGFRPEWERQYKSDPASMSQR